MIKINLHIYSRFVFLPTDKIPYLRSLDNFTVHTTTKINCSEHVKFPLKMVTSTNSRFITRQKRSMVLEISSVARKTSNHEYYVLQGSAKTYQ